MATYIKTLKEDNGDITYPQTKAGAVLLDNGSDLETELSQYVTAEDIASTSALTPPVQTNMIADGAVTSDKIDWTTLPYKYVATLSTQNINSTNPTQLTNMSITIDTAGLYLIALNGNYQAYGTPGSYPRFGVYVGADRKFYSAVSTLAGLQNNFAAIGILKLNVGEVVRGMVTGGACQVFEGCRMVAVRVG